MNHAVTGLATSLTSGCSMFNSRTAILALYLAVAVTSADAAQLHAGPMVGTVSMRSALIWVQSDGATQAWVKYRTPGGKWLNTDKQPLTAAQHFTGHLPVTALEPGQHYEYQVMFDNKPAAGTLSFNTQPLWQWRSEPPPFTVLTGSCLYINETKYDRPGKPYGGEYGILKSMAAAKPDLTLWLGDNLYFREVDYGSPLDMPLRYQRDRALPVLQALLQTGQHYAIWDDHDYGSDDSNKSFIYKGESLALFKDYWANPSYGMPDTPGVFTKISFNDVDFFLLDDRYYRDDQTLQDGPDKAMFGKSQMDWLRNALLGSRATFKVMAAGGQMLNDENKWEGWQGYSEERQRFLVWLAEARINGVLFLSGDRHQTELLKLPRVNTYPLYELTCSPITSSSHNVSSAAKNPVLVEGTLVGERNYCTMSFSGPFKQRVMDVKSFNVDGKQLWEQRIELKELTSAK
jgi:alkaline phosphatase D